MRFLALVLILVFLAGCAGDQQDILPSDLEVAGAVCSEHGGVRIYHAGGGRWSYELRDRITEVTCKDGSHFTVVSWDARYKERRDE